VKHHGHAVAGQLHVAFDGEAADNGGLEGAGAVFDDPDRPLMQAAMGDGGGKQRFAHAGLARLLVD